MPTEASDSTTVTRLAFLRDPLAAERRAYEELAIRIGELHTPGTALLGAGQTPAAAVLARLRPDEALVEYQIVEDSLLIFVGRRTVSSLPRLQCRVADSRAAFVSLGSWSHNETPDSSGLSRS